MMTDDKMRACVHQGVGQSDLCGARILVKLAAPVEQDNNHVNLLFQVADALEQSGRVSQGRAAGLAVAGNN